MLRSGLKHKRNADFWIKSPRLALVGHMRDPMLSSSASNSFSAAAAFSGQVHRSSRVVTPWRPRGCEHECLAN